MDTDRNLLFAVLALQTDFIDTGRFVEVCTLWTTRKDTPLADLLVEKGWLTTADRADIQRLLERKLWKHGGDARSSLAAVADDIKRSLAALDDADIQGSLADLPRGQVATVTLDSVDRPHERYTLIRPHATGGIGRVWLAHDGNLLRDVALKELRPERADNPTLRSRFLREARITGQLEHPGIVPVYELGRRSSDEQPFYTMRLVRGRTLSEAGRAYHRQRTAGAADPIALLDLLNAFVMTCNTVAYAHARGIIHRDLKGQNVLVGAFGEVIVLDWGLAKLMGQPEAAQAETVSIPVEEPDDSVEVDLTAQGQAMGTPAYMSPEQAAGRLDLLGRRTDVYGLGAILYELLTGQPPFAGADTREVLRRVREAEPTPPRQLWPEVPAALEAACLRALAKEPATRQASAGELAQEVQHWQEVQRRQAEEALRRQTHILRSILDSMREGVVVANQDGTLVLFNPAAERILGVPLRDAPPGDWAQRYGCYLPDAVTPCPTEDLPLVRALHGQDVDDAELFVRNPFKSDGAFLSVNARPLRDEGGGPWCAVGVFRDITKRRLAEEELRKSRERFELAVLGSQDGLWDWDIETNVVYYSPRWKGMLGHEDHEVAHDYHEWESRVHPEDRERALATIRAYFDDPAAPAYVLEHRLRHKDGSYRWILARGVALRDAGGRPYRMAGSHEDITERKRAEEELRAERDFNSAVLDTVGALVVVLDREGRIVRFNRTCETTTHYTFDEVKGKQFWELFLIPEEVEPVKAVFAELRAGLFPNSFENYWLTKEGGLRRIAWSNTALVGCDGAVRHIIATGIDITERKLVEQSLRESEALLQTLLDKFPDPVYFKDAAGRFTRINQSLACYLGLGDPAQAVGKSDFDFFATAHADAAHADEQEVMRTGRPVVSKEEKETWLDGRERWVSSTKIPLHDTQGKVIGTFGISRDITPWKQAEESMASERNLLRLLLDSLPDAVWVKDTEGRYLLANLAHARALGATGPEQVAGKTDLDYLSPEVADSGPADERVLIQSGRPPLNREAPAMDTTGSRRLPSTSRLPLRDGNGNLVGIMGISRNITAYERTDEEQHPTEGGS
jgi:PAS domain S-box-containing protein